MHTLAHDIKRNAAKAESTAVNLQPFAPNEICTAIADLVATDELLLADALGIAGLSLYPNDASLLLSCALLAELRQDWVEADRLLAQLIAERGMSASASSWLHWVRVKHCLLQTETAVTLAQLALHEHPQHDDLLQALAYLQKHLQQAHSPSGQPPLAV